MPIKAVIIDCSNTLFSRNIVPGGKEMLDDLKILGIEIYLAANQLKLNYTLQDLLNQGFRNDRILIRSKVDGLKGSGAFVRYVSRELDIRKNEILYLGDSDNDMREAVNENVIFCLAKWANLRYPYGIPLNQPSEFVQLIKTFFLKNYNWFYKVDSKDKKDRQVNVRGLYSAEWTTSTQIRDLLKNKGTLLHDPDYAKRLKQFISKQLLSSIYLEGLHFGNLNGWAKWCIYPGHAGRQLGVLDEFVKLASRLFREQYLEDLIIRHKQAEKSAFLRYNGKPVNIDNQLGTVHLNPQYKDNIENKKILVFDDFTTEGYGFETARNALYNAGAKEVICISVGKYGKNVAQIFSPKENITWDSYKPLTIKETDFITEFVGPTFCDDAQSLIPTDI